MIYGIIGPRDFNGHRYDNYRYVHDVLASFTDVDSLISGGSKGLERMVEQFAKAIGKPVSLIRPDINKFGATAAFTIRNQEIVNACQTLIVFWDGRMADTPETLAFAMRAHREVYLIPMQ